LDASYGAGQTRERVDTVSVQGKVKKCKETRDLRDISQLSCGVLSNLGSEIQRIKGYVTGDKIYYICRASSDALIRGHATICGFPVNRISAVAATIDPTTAEA
jgi:hypothetical protein